MAIHKRQPDIEHDNTYKMAIVISLTIGFLLGAITLDYIFNTGMDEEEKRFKKESILHQIRYEDDPTKRDSLWIEYSKTF